MRPIRRLLLALSLMFAPAVFAQEAIERQMTPAQFKASGLDKLSPAELANLNAWLNRTLEVETTKAAAVAKKKVETDNRGFFDFGSAEPLESRLVGEFRGFGRGREYTLENGQLWRQVDDASLAAVRKVAPPVKITPSMVGNAWYMAIDGYNTRARVERIK